MPILENAAWSKDGVPLNEAAFRLDEWVSMTCCCRCREAFKNYFGDGLPPSIKYCYQCQQYECPDHQHEEI